MQKDASRSRKTKTSTRKSGRASFDKSGRGIWQWQTSTGVFETRITEEQLAQLEASQLTILDAPKEPTAVSYYEWRERSRPVSQPVEVKNTDGAIKRLIKRMVRR
jgi:hypothetical protein